MIHMLLQFIIRCLVALSYVNVLAIKVEAN